MYVPNFTQCLRSENCVYVRFYKHGISLMEIGCRSQRLLHVLMQRGPCNYPLYLPKPLTIVLRVPNV